MNALVMYDHQTRTLWSQFLRKGVKGPLAGVELEVEFALPATIKERDRSVLSLADDDGGFLQAIHVLEELVASRSADGVDVSFGGSKPLGVDSDGEGRFRFGRGRWREGRESGGEEK